MFPKEARLNQIVAPIRVKLYQCGINAHTAGVDTAPDVFFANDNDSVAFTGIYRAKGNEAAMVYVINAQSCYDSYFETAKIRNQLFTAITRSKAWVRVVGVGANMHNLISEYQSAKEHQFTLDFIYPTKSQREHMNIVNRDMSEAEKSRVRKSKSNLANLVDELEGGRVYLDDLDEEQLQRLRVLLNIKGE